MSFGDPYVKDGVYYQPVSINQVLNPGPQYDVHQGYCTAGSCYAGVAIVSKMGFAMGSPSTKKILSPRLRFDGMESGAYPTVSQVLIRYGIWALPDSGIVAVPVGRLIPAKPYCVGFVFQDTDRDDANTYSPSGLFACTDGSGNTELPIPPDPEPSPVACEINAVWGEFDFGTVSVHELQGRVSDISVNIRCKGGVGKNASGYLTLTGSDGSPITKMKNKSGDSIDVKLMAEAGSNTNKLKFAAKAGYFEAHQLYAEIMPFDISSYGDYSGHAILTVTVN